MPERLGVALLELNTDDSKFDGSVTRAEGKAKKLDRGLEKVKRASRSLGRRLSALGNRLGRVAKGFVSVRSAAVAAAGAAGLFFLAKRAIETADAIAKTARSVGLSSETLQEWRFAAGRAGVAVEQLDRGMVRFNRTLGQAQRGEQTYVDLFRDLGVELKNQRGEWRSTESVLNDVVDAMARVPSQAQAGAFAMELFGDRSGRMTRFLGQGAEEINRLRQRARELGVVLSNEVAARAEVAADELGDMSMVLQVAATSAGLELMPAMRMLANALTDQDFLDALREISRLVAQLVVFFIKYHDVILPVVAGLAALSLSMKTKVNPRLAAAIGLLTALASAYALNRDGAKDLVAELEETTAAVEALANGSGSAAGEVFATAEEVQKLTDALVLQNLQMDQLIGRYRDFPSTVQALRDAIELENAAREANIDLSTEQGRAWADQFEQGQQLARTLTDVERITEANRTAQERYNQAVERLDELKPHLSAEAYARELKRLQEELKKAGEETDLLAQGQEVLGSAVKDVGGEALRGNMQSWDAWGDAVEEQILRVLEALVEMQLQIALFGKDGGGGLLESLTSGIGDIFSSIFGGGAVTTNTHLDAHRFGAGGDHPGGARIVGEFGPELEVTGPARIHSATETREILAGAGRQVLELNLSVDNNTEARASAQSERRSDGGVDVMVQLEEAMAARVRRGGTLSDAIMQLTGARRQPLSRA